MVSDLSNKNLTRLDRLAVGKHSSFFDLLVIDAERKFYKIETR
jgi:hypothetical protein